MIQSEIQVEDVVQVIESKEVLFIANTTEEDLNVRDEPKASSKRIKNLAYESS